jgi:hypothetical protein
MFGFGPFAGFLTLSFATIGFIAKLLAEDIEDIDEAQAEAIRATGASWFQLLNYAIQPQVMPRLMGLSLYRLDINFRESAVIGIVGAGGIGSTLNTALNRYEYDSAGAILLIIIAVVMVAEYSSSHLRKWLHDRPRRPRRPPRLAATARRSRPPAALGRLARPRRALRLVLERDDGADHVGLRVGRAGTQAADLGSRMLPPRWEYMSRSGSRSGTPSTSPPSARCSAWCSPCRWPSSPRRTPRRRALACGPSRSSASSPRARSTR